jgi:hypothetical protein
MVKLLLALTFLLSVASNAYAIGGGCVDTLGGSLGAAIKTGLPQDLEREIAKRVDYKQERLGFSKKLVLAAGGEPARLTWRREAALKLIEGKFDYNEHCSPGPLLEAAVRFGNLEIIRYLLGSPMGLNPEVPEGILFACNDSDLRTDEQKARRREAMALILDLGKANVHSKLRDRTILQECTEPGLIQLFIERGADVTVETGDPGRKVNLLDAAVMDAMGFDENSYTQKWLHGIERARIYARILPATIVGRSSERRIAGSCTQLIGGKPWNPRTCRELATFIKASPGTFAQDSIITIN